MASAKLANRTVNQSHEAIWNSKPKPLPPAASVAEHQDCGEHGPNLDDEHTGFFASVTGFSLTNESTIARRTIGGSNNGLARLPRDKPMAVESPGMLPLASQR